MEEKGKSKPVYDINSLRLDDDELVINPTADPDARQVPPERKYAVKATVNKNNGTGVTEGKGRRGRSFLMMQLVNTIVADGTQWNGMKIFDSRSTLVLDSSGTCGLMAIPRALNVNVPTRPPKPNSCSWSAGTSRANRS